MLVLWDPSWALRLWCVFELAASGISLRCEGTQQDFYSAPKGATGSYIVAVLTPKRVL